jgi:hypothetical protein
MRTNPLGSAEFVSEWSRDSTQAQTRRSIVLKVFAFVKEDLSEAQRGRMPHSRKGVRGKDGLCPGYS